MKKKIFVTAMLVIVLCCLLAIGASAVAYDETRTTIEYTDCDGNTHTVPVVKYDVEPSTVNDANKSVTGRSYKGDLDGLEQMDDDSALCIVKATDGTLTAYPSWYIIDADGTAVYEISYGYLNSVTGKTYNEGAIVYMEFPQGMSYVRNNGVFCQKQTNQPYETNVTEFHIPKTVTYIEQAFNSMQKLESVYIEEGSQITEIKSGAFSNSTVKYVQIENLTELTSIDGFTNCGITGDLDFSNTKLVTIKSACFQNSKNIGKITLPDTVETIANNAFENCGSAYLASPYLPANLKSVGTRFFAYNSNLLDTYIFPEGVTELPNEPFQDSKVAGGPSGKELNLVFLGEVTGVVYLNGNGHQKHAEKVTVYFAKNSLSDYNTNGFYIKPSGSSTTSVPGAIRVAFCEGTYASVDGKITGIEYIYITNTNGSVYTEDMVNDATNGFDFTNHRHFGAQNVIKETCGKDGFIGTSCIVCDEQIGEVIPATGDHKYTDDHNCTTADVCTVCSQTIVEALEHIIGTVYKYENGYSNEGLKLVGCTREGCEHGERTVIDALIVSYGYSKEENGVGITHTAKVNKDAILEYQAYLNQNGGETKIIYGIVVAIDDADGTPVTSDGKVNEGYKAVLSDNSDTTYTILRVKVCGITETAQKLNLGAYIIVDGQVGYIYGLSKQIGNKAESVSYSDL